MGAAGEAVLRRPRLVATDLDGTLLRSDGSVSDRTRAVWAATDEAGIETVLVTARPPRWLHDLSHVVGPRGIAICGNGAFVYEVAGRRLLETHCFEPGAVEAIVADLIAALPSVAFLAERASGPYLGPGYPDPHDDSLAEGAVRGPVSGIAAEPVGKLLAVTDRLPLEEFLSTVEEVVGSRGHLHFSGAFGLAEINAPGVTKAVALERWATRLGIDAADVWAFGDMPNDLPMIRWAGVGGRSRMRIRRCSGRPTARAPATTTTASLPYWSRRSATELSPTFGIGCKGSLRNH